jgi:hypothetical protein
MLENHLFKLNITLNAAIRYSIIDNSKIEKLPCALSTLKLRLNVDW